LDRQYSNCVVGWSLSTLTVLWVGQSVQELCFGVDNQYSNCVVGWTVTTEIVFGLDSQYSNCVFGWTVSTASLLWVGHSEH